MQKQTQKKPKSGSKIHFMNSFHFVGIRFLWRPTSSRNYEAIGSRSAQLEAHAKGCKRNYRKSCESSAGTQHNKRERREYTNNIVHTGREKRLLTKRGNRPNRRTEVVKRDKGVPGRPKRRLCSIRINSKPPALS